MEMNIELVNQADFLGKLRPIDDSELELMLSWRNSDEVRKNMYTTSIIELNDHLQWYANVQKSLNKCYLMYENQRKPLGIVAFTDIDAVNKQSSWAFYSDPKSPRGTGGKMEFLALDYAFNVLKMHKLSCEVLDYNTAVIRLHKKFGFRQEGYFREQHLHQNHYCGVYRFGILKAEWQKERPTMLELLVKLNQRI